MQARGGLVQDVQGSPGVALTQLLAKFDALRFASRQRGGGLTEPNVTQANVQ